LDFIYVKNHIVSNCYEKTAWFGKIAGFSKFLETPPDKRVR